MTAGPNDLFQGERVLWVGTPARVTVLDRLGKFWLGLGVCYGLLITVLAVVVVRTGAPNQLVLIALATVFILGVVVAALLQLRSGRRSTRYLITDRRIVHTTRWFGQDKVRIVALRELGPPALSVPEGSTIGTIRFGNRTAWDEAIDAISSLGRTGSIVLKHIDNVHQVHDIILAAQADAQ